MNRVFIALANGSVGVFCRSKGLFVASKISWFMFREV